MVNGGTLISSCWVIVVSEGSTALIHYTMTSNVISLLKFLKENRKAQSPYLSVIFYDKFLRWVYKHNKLSLLLRWEIWSGFENHLPGLHLMIYWSKYVKYQNFYYWGFLVIFTFSLSAWNFLYLGNLIWVWRHG